MWYVPPQRTAEHVRSKPCDLIGNLLGHEGAGSVLSYLKKRGLATELFAGLDDGDSTSAAALLRVSVVLTRAGVGAMDDVARAVCATDHVTVSSINAAPTMPIECPRPHRTPSRNASAPPPAESVASALRWSGLRTWPRPMTPPMAAICISDLSSIVLCVLFLASEQCV